MNIVALIPARAGSKRIINKNKKKLLGKPLISWTIDTVKKVKEVSDIFVSTDDKDIIEIAKKLKVKAPWLRPKKLCTDSASSVDVAVHFLNWYEKKYKSVDGLLLLQPTSPFRKKSSIIKAIKLFKKNKNSSVISFSFYLKRLLNNTSSAINEFKGAPTDKKTIKQKTLELIYLSSNKNKDSIKRLNLKKLSVINGSIYLISPKNLRKYKSMAPPRIKPLVQNSVLESIDIDTLSDWKIASALYKYKSKINN